MKRARIKQSDRLGVQIFVVTWVTLSIVFSFVPLYVTILNSLKPHSAIAANIFSFAISFSAIRDNFTLAFNSIWRPMLNSIFVAFVGAFLNMMLGAVMAYIFSRKQFFGREFLFKVYIVILLVPSVMGMPVLLDFITKANLMNSYFAIWLPVIGGGQAGALFLFRTFFSCSSPPLSSKAPKWTAPTTSKYSSISYCRSRSHTSFELCGDVLGAVQRLPVARPRHFLGG